MKKSFLFLVLTGLFVFNSNISFTQDKPNQFSAGYGVFTVDEELSIIEDVISSMITVGSFTTDNIQMTGAVIFTYNYALSKVVHLGGAFAYENITEDVFINPGTGKTKAGELNRNFYTLAAEAKFSYVHANIFQMYSGVGVGATLNTDEYKANDGKSNSDTQGHFNFQINLVGLRIGNAFAGFAELGYGYKGILNFGLSLRL
jgi:hypothetical protein